MDSPQTADLNLRLLRPIVRYVTDYFGQAELERIAKASGLKLSDLDGSTRWAALEQMESVLAHVRKLLPDDRAFLQACSYELDKTPGPIRFVIGAISPTAAYEIGCKNMRLISTVSQFEFEMIQRGEVRIRYRSRKPESRLMCISRQAQITNLPRLWGLPPAHVAEESCLAHGDASCSYHVHVYEARRWIPAALGLASGAALFGILQSAGHPISSAWIAVAAMVGYFYDQRTAAATNRRTQEDINAAYLQMASDDTEARRELFELTQRQKMWGHLMEDEVIGKTGCLHQLVNEVEELQPTQVVRLRRAAGDDSPLTKIRSGLEQLRGIAPSEVRPTVERLSQTVVVLDRKLRTIARLAGSSPTLVSLCARTVPVAPLADELRNRLKALVRGKDVRVSVFTVREAPEQITIDTALLNRIVDNLLLNAAEFTDRGSIVLEVGGTPDFLTIKISDTGGTLREDEVGKMFRPMSRGPEGYGYGAGLSVVVQLLASVGGKLEVMTHEGKGTTFWAHFPLHERRAKGDQDGGASSEGGSAETSEFAAEALTVRKFEGA